MTFTPQEFREFALALLKDQQGLTLPDFQLDTPKDPTDAPTLTHRDGRKIYLSQKGYGVGASRMIVSGSWPQGLRGDYRSPREWGAVLYNHTYQREITCDPARGAAIVARDIARRFLPEYTRLWGLCMAQSEREHREREAHSLLVQSFAVAYGPGARVNLRDQRDTDRPSMSFHADDIAYGDADQYGHVTLHVYEGHEQLTRDVLAVVARYVKEHVGPGADTWECPACGADIAGRQDLPCPECGAKAPK